MRVAVLSPVAWRTPPDGYGPWEQVASNIAEGLVERGHDVTLFATGDSRTRGHLASVVARGYEEDRSVDARIVTLLHVAACAERARDFDLIHNHFDFTPLAFAPLMGTPMLTTIHGFSSPGILPLYRWANGRSYYASISDADRDPSLTYMATVHNGIRLNDFTPREEAGEHLLFLGRLHPEKGAHLAIDVARMAGMRLVIAGIIQDREYFTTAIQPRLDPPQIEYVGPVDARARDKLLGGAAALLHLVTRPERFGLTMVEAFACGTPVIGVDLGSVAEVVTDGVTGFVVRSVDEAVAAVARIGDISRSRCRHEAEQRFSADTMVDAYLDVYARVLEDWPRRRASSTPASLLA
jgi:glycosyltransferase involved in cell wall biosynthesis